MIAQLIAATLTLASSVAGLEAQAPALRIIPRQTALASGEVAEPQNGAKVDCKTALFALGRAYSVTVIFLPGTVGHACGNGRSAVQDKRSTVEQAIADALSDTTLSVVKLDERVFMVVRHAVATRPAASLPVVTATGAPSLEPTAPVAASLVSRVPFDLGSVDGDVRDAITGAAIPLVTIVVDASEVAARTDSAGRFRLAGLTAGRHILTATRIGYRRATLTINVADGSSVSARISMEAASAILDKSVTTATGTFRSVEVGNAVGTIDAQNVVETGPVTSLSNVLEARVPGVMIEGYTGAVGESPRIRIRGLSSISKTRDPLVYVDGVRIESTALTSPDGGGIFASGRLNDFNPDEFESVEIVKGPSAATLYGTDAANGVILITTKKGRPDRSRWSIDTEGGTITPSVSFPDTYYSFGTNLSNGAQQRCLLVQQAAGVCRVDSLTHFNPLNDPATSPIGVGTRDLLSIQTSGGTGRMTYFLSGSREDEANYLRMPAEEVKDLETIRGVASIPDNQIHPNSLGRTSLRANSTINLGQNASVTISNGLVSGYTRIPRAIYYTYVSALWSPGYRDSVYHGWFSRYGRPEEIFANTSQEDITRYTSSIATQWQASRWLSTRGTVGFDNSDSQLDALDQQGQGMIPTGDRVNIRTVTPVITGDFGASANTFINEHLSSRTSVGVQYTNRLQRTERFEGAGLPAGGQTVAGAQTVTVSESTNQAVVAGGYLEQLLGWRDELFVTGAVRADGGSSFGKNFHTAVYPKASVSWLALGSGSSRQVEWIDRLRLRFAYGTSGVQPGSTDALPLYTRFTTLVDGANASGAALIATGNPDLRPERSSEMETGADADFLGGRVSLEATYYNRLSRDALIQRPLPTSSGLSSQWVNVGALRNRGAELGLNLRLAETRRFTASLGVNGSYNANKLITLGIPNTTAIGSSDARSVAGYPILSRWAKPILGYADANHNGIIEPTEVRVGDSVVFIGPSDPPRQATVSPTLTFLRGALTFRSVFQYAGGQTGENSGMTTGCRDFPSCRAVNDPSAPLADQAAAVALVTYKTSAGYLQDATFWRWREASLTYDVPEQFRRPLHARTLSVTVSARNLWLWTHYGYPDPEGNNGFADLPEGTVTQATMPQPRYFLLRLNLNY